MLKPLANLWLILEQLIANKSYGDKIFTVRSSRANNTNAGFVLLKFIAIVRPCTTSRTWKHEAADLRAAASYLLKCFFS